MANILVLSVAFVYVVTGICYCYDNKIGLGIAFVAYAVANIGLYLSARGI